MEKRDTKKASLSLTFLMTFRNGLLV